MRLFTRKQSEEEREESTKRLAAVTDHLGSLAGNLHVLTVELQNRVADLNQIVQSQREADERTDFRSA